MLELFLGPLCQWVAGLIIDAFAADVFDFSGNLADAANLIWERNQNQGETFFTEALRELASLPDGEVARVVTKVVQDNLSGQPGAVRRKVGHYLTQVPSQVRRTLRRLTDPRGATVPGYLGPRKAADLIPFLPPRFPRFQPGDRPLAGVDLQLTELLGIGGFGEVWKAVNPLLPGAEPVALKFCLDPQAARLLRHEATVLDRVMRNGRHPDIVALRHTYLTADPPCLEYEFIEGGDLAGLILGWHAEGGGPSAKQAARLILRLAEIVGFAHSQDPPIVHRDLKPANILVRKDKDGRTRLLIADFGIGGLATQRRVTSATGLATTVARGSHTPLYASPQQSQGGLADPRDDIFALGVIWYQMLTGDILSGAPAGMQWYRRLAQAGIPEEHLELLGSCVEYQAEDRPANAVELATRLKVVLREGSGSTPRTEPASHSPLPRRPDRTKSKSPSPTASWVPAPTAAQESESTSLLRTRLVNHLRQLQSAYSGRSRTKGLPIACMVIALVLSLPFNLVFSQYIYTAEQKGKYDLARRIARKYDLELSNYNDGPVRPNRPTYRGADGRILDQFKDGDKAEWNKADQANEIAMLAWEKRVKSFREECESSKLDPDLTFRWILGAAAILFLPQIGILIWSLIRRYRFAVEVETLTESLAENYPAAVKAWGGEDLLDDPATIDALIQRLDPR